MHLIAVLKPPKGTMEEIEIIFANFLWGEKQGAFKFHWRKWKDLCYPTEEGGIGFKSLEDTCAAFSIKLWWKFRKNESLWAEFLHDKYVGQAHPMQVSVSYNSSHVWRRMLEYKELAEFCIIWEINDGNSSALCDNWIGDKAFGEIDGIDYCPIKIFISNGR